MREVKMKISLIALCMWLSAAIQSEPFERRAIFAAQQTPASSLDAKLPNRSFVAWLDVIVGREAGIVWQLAECGADAPGGTGQDPAACAEATVLMPNGDTVIIGISVGTFKKGLVGKPAFQGAVIKTDERIRQVRRLSDLPGMLSPSGRVLRALPDLQAGPLRVEMLPATTYPLLASLGPDNDNSAPRFLASDEDDAPPPPPRRKSGWVVDPRIFTRAKPVSPPAAKAMGIPGKVQVRVVISESGRVIEATAVSGPMTLRAAAAAAARQLVYKPATRDGVPVRAESVLTITFGDQ
jgi:TonB family protein